MRCCRGGGGSQDSGSTSLVNKTLNWHFVLWWSNSTRQGDVTWWVGVMQQGRAFIGSAVCHDLLKKYIKSQNKQHFTTFCCHFRKMTKKTFRAKKNVLLSMHFSSFFHAMYSSCPKEFKNAKKIKNAKKSSLVRPTYLDEIKGKMSFNVTLFLWF